MTLKIIIITVSLSFINDYCQKGGNHCFVSFSESKRCLLVNYYFSAHAIKVNIMVVCMAKDDGEIVDFLLTWMSIR